MRLRFVASVFLCAVLMGLCTSCASQHAPAPSVASDTSFDLEVQLHDIYNSDFSVTMLVRTGQAFIARCKTGGIVNTFRGELHEEKDGHYPLDLSISEWQSPTSNLTGSASYKLRLNESWSGGIVSSFTFDRTIILRRHNSEL